MSDYWSKRKNFTYYAAIRAFCLRYSPHGGTVLDVGSGISAGCMFYKSLGKKFKTTSIEHPEFASKNAASNPKHEGVKFYFADLDFGNVDLVIPTREVLLGGEKFDVVICSQMLEHLNTPELTCFFLNRCVKHSGTLILSTPYKWRAGQEPGHIQDPVDEKKVFSWMRKPPTECKIVWDKTHARQIFVYRN